MFIHFVSHYNPLLLPCMTFIHAVIHIFVYLRHFIHIPLFNVLIVLTVANDVTNITSFLFIYLFVTVSTFTSICTIFVLFIFLFDKSRGATVIVLTG